MNNKKIQSNLETIFKLLTAVGIVLLLLGIVQQSGFPNIIKGTIGMVLGVIFISIGNFVERKASPKWQRFFSLFPNNGTTYCGYNKTPNKQANRYGPAPPYPHEKAKHNHQSPNKAEHTTRSPLDNFANKLHINTPLWGLFYRLSRRLSTKMQKNPLMG